MPDADLRELERRAQAGDPEARTRLLAERLRRGLLHPERARVALLLGHGSRGAAPVPSGWAWLKAVAESGAEAGLRASVAAAAHVEPIWAGAYPDDTRFADALEAIRAWWVRPSAETRASAVEAALRLPDPSPISYPPNRVSRCLRRVGAAIRTDDDAARRAAVLDALRFAHQTSVSSALQAALSDALMPWALGEDAASR